MRRLMLENMKGGGEMAEWKKLTEVTLSKKENVAFDLKGLDVSEIYIFANAVVTESGNTSLDFENGVGIFTNITSKNLLNQTIHVQCVGDNVVAEEVGGYSLKGYMNTSVTGSHAVKLSTTKIKNIKLFRNAPTYTFLEGSTFEVWGR